MGSIGVRGEFIGTGGDHIGITGDRSVRVDTTLLANSKGVAGLVQVGWCELSAGHHSTKGTGGEKSSVDEDFGQHCEVGIAWILREGSLSVRMEAWSWSELMVF